MPNKSQFLWVNKSAQSRSLSNSVEDGDASSIYAHAQGNPSRKSTGRRRPFVKYTPRFFEWQRREETAAEADLECETNGGRRSSQTSTYSSKSPNRVSEDSQALVVRKQRSLSPVDSYIGASPDPFSSFAVEINPAVLTELQYFESVWTQAAFRSPAGLSSTQEESRDIVSIVRSGLEDEIHLNAILATVSMRMQIVHGTSVSTPGVKPRYYATKALTAFRKHLMQSQVVTSERALDMLLFACYEVYCFNLEGTRTHLQALQATNSESYLRGYARSLACKVDLFIATVSLTPPLLDLTQEYFRHSDSAKHFSDVLVDDDIATVSGCSFQRHQELFDHATFAVIQVIARCGRVARLYYEDPALFSEDLDVVQHLVEWAEELSYRIICCCPLPTQQSNPLQEAVMITIMMWLSYLPSSLMSQSRLQASTVDFRKVIPGRGTLLVQRLHNVRPSIPSSSADVLELILWVASVGTICSVDADDVEYCAYTFIEAAQRLEIKEKADLSERLNNYLWMDHFDAADYEVMLQLLQDESREAALFSVISWAYQTRMQQEGDKSSVIRVTNRPSNQYRLGA